MTSEVDGGAISATSIDRVPTQALGIFGNTVDEQRDYASTKSRRMIFITRRHPFYAPCKRTASALSP